MLLWSKALALESGAPGAAEWGWWIDRLSGEKQMVDITTRQK